MPGQQFNFKVSDYAVSQTGYLLKVTTLRPSAKSYFLVYIPFGRYSSVLMLDFLVTTRKEVPAALHQQISQAIREDMAAMESGIVILEQEPIRSAEVFSIALAEQDPRFSANLQTMQVQSRERLGVPTDLAMAEQDENSRRSIHSESLEARISERSREGYVLLDVLGQIKERESNFFDDVLPAAIKPKESESITEADGFQAERPIDWDFNVLRNIFISNRISASGVHKLQMKDLGFRVDKQDLLIDLQNEAGFRPFSSAGTVMQKRGAGHRLSLFDLRVNTERLLGHRTFNWEGEVSSNYSTGHRIFNWLGDVLNDREEAKRLLTWDAVSVVPSHTAGQRKDNSPTKVDYYRIRATRVGDNHPTIQVPNLVSALRDDAINEAIVPLEYKWAEIKTRQYKTHLTKEIQSVRRKDFLTIRDAVNLSGYRNGERQMDTNKTAAAWRFTDFLTDIYRIRQAARDVLNSSSVLIPSSAKRKIDKIMELGIDTLGSRGIHRTARVLEERSAGARSWDGRLHRHEVGMAVRSANLLAYLTHSEKAEITRKVVIQVMQEFGRAYRNPLQVYLPREIGAAYRPDWLVTRLLHIKSASNNTERNTEIFRTIFSSKNLQKNTLLSQTILGARDATVPVYHLSDALGSFKKAKDLYVPSGAEGAKVRQGGIPLAELTDEPTYANGITIPRASNIVEELERLFSENAQENKWGMLPEDLDIGVVDRKLMGTILDVIYAWKGFFSDFLDPMIFADRSHNGHSLLEYAIRWANKERAAELMSSDFLVGARGRIEALIESKVVFANDQAYSGLLVFNVKFADREILREAAEFREEEWASQAPKYSHVEEVRQLVKNQIPSYLEEGLEANDMLLRPAVIHVENPFGYFEPDPSYLGSHTQGRQTGRLTHVEEGKTSGKPRKPSEISEFNLGSVDERISHYEVGVQGTEPNRQGNILDDTEMDRFTKPSVTGAELEGIRPDIRSALSAPESLLAKQDERPVLHLEEGKLGQQVNRQVTQLGEEKLGKQKERSSMHTGEGGTGGQVSRDADTEESSLAELQERLSYLASGYIFGEHQDRAGFIAEMYYEAVRFSKHDSILNDSLLGYARLVFHQAFLEEHMFANKPSDAAELLEDIVGRMEPFPAINHDVVIADKREHYTELLVEIAGTKELAEAVLEEYLSAVKRLKDSTFNQDLTVTERIKQAFMEAIQTEGQGLVYDYSNGVLENGMDPEDWTGGYGVPEDYDPHDPANPYYPWVKDLDTLELGQDEWIRFDNQPTTAWSREPNQGLFKCEQRLDTITGLYRNDFSHEDYMFEADFRVDSEEGDNAAGILFRYTNPQNYYMFVIHGGDVGGTLGMSRPMQLYKVVDGQQLQLGAPMNSFAWERNKWYKLQVSVEGSRIKLSVSGRLQYDFTD